jgi:ribosomal protein S18 acetylase RimI-like enzyme
MAQALVEPTTEQILRFCAEDPVERVFLEDVARRGGARFAAVEDGASLRALCHLGTNVVPAGRGCAAFSALAARAGARMLIGEEGAVTELWDACRRRLQPPREDRPGQPVYAISEPPPPGDSGLRAATVRDLDLLVPACAAAHREELGVDPLRRDASGFRWRTRSQIEERRSWIWSVGGTIRFKAEASAWTPSAVQLQQVWVDPAARRRGYASRALRDLIRELLDHVPTVCLFVRAENEAAIRLYETIGMRRVLWYRSVLL